jgi:hypothetical protein
VIFPDAVEENVYRKDTNLNKPIPLERVSEDIEGKRNWLHAKEMSNIISSLKYRGQFLCYPPHRVGDLCT